MRQGAGNRLRAVLVAEPGEYVSASAVFLACSLLVVIYRSRRRRILQSYGSP